ncbi:hypothetical protein ACVWZV_003082 [Bradyrhizobium sp. GM5.1]
MISSAAWPSSTAILRPARRQPCAVLWAVVATLARSNRAARSECASASFNDPSAIFGRMACFCAMLPHRSINAAPSTTDAIYGSDTSPRPKASIKMPISTALPPSPPHSSAIGSASQPSSANCFHTAGLKPSGSFAILRR